MLQCPVGLTGGAQPRGRWLDHAVSSLGPARATACGLLFVFVLFGLVSLSVFVSVSGFFVFGFVSVSACFVLLLLLFLFCFCVRVSWLSLGLAG